ncbi:MAG: UPF0149 family protein [Candidatus Accumulibacter sp.]|uniref:UPF0149 family protein n=1 Tax=Candidatus Accumulibacter proximus TaxID=2954385 RepID=A0A935PX83_9PROT|nr:UPF0149 family protein [Candidatus Accumulibacter proximus]
MSVQAQLTDNQLLRLEQLLGDPVLERAMRLDEAQGYLCAALSGPQPAPESQWLSDVLGDSEKTAGDAWREAAHLLRLLRTQLQAELANGEPPLLLLYAVDEEENSASDYVPWCQAYLHGIDTAPVGWFEALDADDDKEDSEEIAYLDEQLFPLFMLTGDAEAAATAAGEEWLSGRDLERMREECEENLPHAVTNIYRFWIAQRRVKTVRREDARIGRNDPCPCGSGKKFKKCCGAVPAESV